MKDNKFITQEFADMIVSTKLDDIEHKVIEKAKYIVLDYIGNLIGSKISDTAKPSIRLAEKLGGEKECTIIGSNKKVSAMNAVLANAMGGYSFDFVDDHNDSVAHPSPATIPVSLNMSEKYNLSGKEFLEAFIVGNEVIARAGSAYLGDMPKQSFHPTAVLGTMGATASASKVMRLNKEELINAQGIAINSMAGGLYAWNSYNNNSKRVNAAQPARNGILASMMAKEGITGPIDVYEGRFGAFNAFSYNKKWDSTQALRKLGKEWQFSNSSIKPYPACRYAGGNIDACLKLMNENGIKIENIESIVFASQKPQIDNIMLPMKDKKNPKNMVEMQHSLPYCGAIALKRKRFNVEDLNTENLNDPEIKRLMSITDYKIDKELNEKYPKSYSTSVIVSLNNGLEYKSVIDYPLGDWRNPVSNEFVKDKFRSLAKEGINNESRLEEIIDFILNIENKKCIKDLMRLINYYYN